MGNGINGQIPDGNDLALLTPGNGCAQPGTNTSNELGGPERLTDVVVGSSTKSLDDIRGVSAGSEHDDRDA